jgi:hypothetical protein
MIESIKNLYTDNIVKFLSNLFASNFNLEPFMTFLTIFFFYIQNIEKGKKYKVIFYVRSTEEIDLKISFVGSEDGVKLASTDKNLLRLSTHHDIFPLYLLSDLILYNNKNN